MTLEHATMLYVGDELIVKDLGGELMYIRITKIKPFTDLYGKTRPIITGVDDTKEPFEFDIQHIIRWKYSVFADKMISQMASL